jgi:hypothetical protein
MGETFEMRIPGGVELVKTAEPARWAIERMDPADDPSRWHLSTFMPAGFDSYVRILHPLADRGGEGPSWRWERFARHAALPIAPEAQLKDVVGHERFDQGWLDAYAPRDGSMSARTCATLIALLRGFTRTPELCWMAVWDGWGSWWPQISVEISPDASPSERSQARAEGFRRAWEQHSKIRSVTADIRFVERPWGRRYFLFKAPIDKAPAFHSQTPQLWWPDDRSWFVSTEIDGFSSYVGASRDCTDAILRDSAFEAIEVPWDVYLDEGL